MANARRTVQNALMRVHEDGGYSTLVLNAALQQGELSPKDSAFAGALFYGVLERQLTLDFVINAYSKTPVAKMDPPVREALRMGVYQLLYMDAVPDRAAINESVCLIRNSRLGRLSGFVNGILRSVQRGGNRLPGLERLPFEEQLSVTYSMPQPLVRHYIQHYGQENAEALMASFLGQRPTYLRVNCCKIQPAALQEMLQAEGVTTEEDPRFCHMLRVTAGGGKLIHTAAYGQGLFHVQDPSSFYACTALSVQPGHQVLDVCAAPGGKSFTTAQLMQNTGRVTACDIHPHKIGLLKEGAARLGLTCVQPVLRDALQPSAKGAEFDRILCDLPCSGLGVLGRKPEIRYKTDIFLDNLPVLQYGMLCNSLRCLKPGGILVFSTCTLNPAENEENVARLLAEHPFLTPNPILPALPRVCGEGAHFINLLPPVHGTDGFFIAAVKREG